MAPSEFSIPDRNSHTHTKDSKETFIDLQKTYSVLGTLNLCPCRYHHEDSPIVLALDESVCRCTRRRFVAGSKTKRNYTND